MNRASIESTTVAGHAALVLQNSHLRATILPALGGRVWTLEDRARNRQWIWHRPGVPLIAHSAGASYDDVWAGGWEELFPNDAAGPFEGRQLPDHGEWWTLPFEAAQSIDDRSARVRLTTRSTIIKAECTKEFILDHDAPAIVASYRIRSLESQPFSFLFKQHLPVDITPACRLALPGGRVEPVDPSFGTILKTPDAFEWPGADDLRQIPPASSAAREFVYVRDLMAPWCGVDDLERRASLRMEYDGGDMPFVWLFLSYGGWRDVYTAVLEPCTNLPKDLATAVQLGQSAVLNPGGVFDTTVTVRVSELITTAS